MYEPNILLKNCKLTAGQKVSKLVDDHPVIATLTVIGILIGLTVLLTKTKNHSDTNSGRYTEFDIDTNS